MFTRYKIIRSFKELKQLVEACLNTGYASVDFETNAEGIYKDTFKPTILSVSFQVGSGCSIPLQHFDESVKEIPWLKWLQYYPGFGQSHLLHKQKSAGLSHPGFS